MLDLVTLSIKTIPARRNKNNKEFHFCKDILLIEEMTAWTVYKQNSFIKCSIFLFFFYEMKFGLNIEILIHVYIFVQQDIATLSYKNEVKSGEGK